jgi:tetratricopeptide (TPR) repeat protein
MDESLYRSWLLMSSGRLEQSEQQIREHLSRNPDDAEAHITLAICLCDLSRHYEAIDSARKAIALDPQNSYYYWGLGIIYLRSKQINLNLAETYINQAIELDPESPDFYASLAETYFLKAAIIAENNNQVKTYLDRGIEAANLGLEIDPEHHDCLVYLFNNILATKDKKHHPEAIEIAQELISLFPESAVAHEIYARSLLCQFNRQPNKQDVKRILAVIEESLRLNPNRVQAKNLGFTLLEKHYQFNHPILSWLNQYYITILISSLPLLILTLYSYAIWGLQTYQTIISFFLTLASLILVSESTYIRWRISQHPHYRNYLVSDPTIRKFWKGFTFIVAIAIICQFLPLVLINFITLLLGLFLFTVELYLCLSLLRKIFPILSPILTWSGIEKIGSQLEDRINSKIQQVPGSRFINSKSWANGCVLTMGGCGFFIAVFVIIAIVTLVYPIIKSIK